MTKRMLIDALHPEEVRVVIADEKQIFDFDHTSASKKQLKGNIYLAKITRVEPSLQAAFVEYGGGKQGFLPFAEIHPDYYQIPVSDRQRLLDEAESEGENDSGEGNNEKNNAVTDESSPAEMGADDGEAATQDAASLPEFNEIIMPDSDERPEEEVEENESEAAQEKSSSLAFTTSEVVTQNEVENEELAGKLNGNAEALEKDSSEENVETIESEDDEELSGNKKRNQYHRRYKIQEVIKRGQIVLVQVIKEERGNKGVSLTTFLSLPGRYSVLMPNSPKDGGISRKISDATTRKRLKEILSELRLTRGMSVIIRTAGIDRTRAEIRRDFEYLVKLWNTIRENTLSSTAPALIYEESDLIKRAIRDQYTSDIDEVLVAGEDAFNAAHDFMKMLLPSHTPRVKHYKESMPLFYAYNIEDQLLSMYDPMVKLKSGGYLIINPTEALISIDVNSGRATSERNIEETATKTNLEAAHEIARQLRLRDLAGLIVIDFIDMMESRNRRAVERALKDALKSDRAKIQLGRISPFGLLEMSRQRLRPSISESSTVQCPHCTGRGVIRSNESMSIQILRALEKEASTGNWQSLKLNVPEHIALYVLNHKRDLLSTIENKHGVQIIVAVDHDLNASTCTIEKMRRSQQQRPAGEEEDADARHGRDRRRDRGRGRPRDRDESAAEEPKEATAPSESAGEDSEEEKEENRGRVRRRRGRRGGRGRRRGGEGLEDGSELRDDANAPESDNTAEAEDVPVAAAETEESAGSAPKRGARGGRGRRKRNEEEDAEEQKNAIESDAQEEKPAKSATSRSRRTRTPRPTSDKSADEDSDAAGTAEKLPEFTRSAVVETRPPEPEKSNGAQPASHMHSNVIELESTHRAPGEPPRKGWWQRMIELD